MKIASSFPAPSPAAWWLNRVSPQLHVVWRGRWRAGTIEPARYLCDHELVLVTEGSCTVQVENRSHDLGAGQYIIIPPDTYHVTTTRRGVYRNCIHFDWVPEGKPKPWPVWRYHPERPARAEMVRRPTFVPAGLFCGKFPPFTPVASVVETLFHRWQTGEQMAQALARGTFLELLVLLLSPPGARARVRAEKPGLELACAARDLLDARGDSDEGVQALLESLGWSYPHVSRVFRSAFGITPVEYRTALRLERAKALLRDPRLTVAEVAYAAGFSDAGYFARQFRKRNGVSPRQMRRFVRG